MQKLFTLLLLLLVGSYGLQAQQDQRLAATKTPLSEVERLQLPTQDNKELLKAEMANRAPGVAPRFAEVMPVDVSPATHGNWEIKNNKAVWRLRIPSPGAKSLNFGFDQFFMPVGGSLIIYTPDLEMIRGPFTPADNEEHEELWTPIIPNDELVIEVSLPLERKDELKLHLKTVNHDFLGFAESVVSGACNVDVVCGLADGYGIIEDYRDIIQSVAVYSTGGSTFCTGFLVASTLNDCTPLFITANHCGINANTAASLITYWNFNNSICREPGSGASGGAGDGMLNDFNTGSIFRAGYGPTDFTLVELDDPVSETADAWFAGWDATDNLEQDTLIAIHHPSTDEKRISFQYNGVYRGSWGSNDTPVPDGDHIVIEDWDIGTTEGGSSGSPLFDSEKRAVGQLHGGFAACGNDDYDIYGWFHSSWTGGGTPSTRLSDWLDPNNTGTMVKDGHPQLQCSYFAGATPVTQSLCAPDDAQYEIVVNEAFTGPVTLSIDGLPAELTAVLGETIVMPNGATNMTISGSGGLSTGVYTFQLLGTDGVNSSSQELTLAITNGLPVTPVLNFPTNMTTGESTTVSMIWEPLIMVATYDIEMATDPAFINIIATESGLTSPSFVSSVLDVTTIYYWRVRASNFCGVGDWSSPFSFETGAIYCGIESAIDSPIDIGPQNGSVTTSNLDVTVTGAISSIRVVDLDIKHTWTGDLSATLTSPDGITIDLFNRPDCNRADMLVSFEEYTEQSAMDFENTCDGGGVSIAGTFQPAESFSAFAGEEASGVWVLTIRDNANNDGGQLDGWDLELCTLIPDEASVSSSIQTTTVCAGNDVAFNLTLGTGFEGDVSLSVTGLPVGAILNFETNPATPGSVLNTTITSILVPGNYTIDIIAEDGISTVNTPIELIVTGAPGFANLMSPVDQNIIVESLNTFEWDAVVGTTAYVLEIATDDVFSNLVLDIDLNDTTTTLDLFNLGLEIGQQYYWRVTTSNECGESVSSFFSFVFNLTSVQEIGNATLNIHPNPTYGPLKVSLSGDLGSNELTIDAFASNGQKVAGWKLSAIAGTQELDLSALPAGVYWLNITSGKLHVTEKIVLIR